MYKKLTIVICLFIIAFAAKADEGTKVSSEIKKVVVFLNSAQVTRTAEVSIKSGTSTLIFTNISTAINAQSIQVNAKGNFTILSVKHELSYNDKGQKEILDNLQAQQKAINDKIAFQNALLNINQQEESMLLKSLAVKSEHNDLDMLKLKKALDFQTLRLTEIKQKQLAINNQLAALQIEQQKNYQDIAEANAVTKKASGNILVTVSSKTDLNADFTLSYLVSNANWYPTYDIKAQNVNSPITIAYKANVTQRTGEDWKAIKLVLSTGNPTMSGIKPQLNPYYINTGITTFNPSVTKVTGRVTDSRGEALIGATVRVKGSSLATSTNSSGDYIIQIPPGSQMIQYLYAGYNMVENYINSSVINVRMFSSQNNLEEVTTSAYGVNKALADISVRQSTIPLAVQQVENQTNVEFNIDETYFIPSDGKQYTVEIAQHEVPATYQYYVAPKLSTNVFLTAQVTDWNKYNFLSGEASLIFEGTYIGKSVLDTRAINDTLNLSLGVDKSIVVTRTPVNVVAEKQATGANKRETKNWLLNIKNRKAQPVNLLVEDQVPVSQNAAIVVDVQEQSGGILNRETGKVNWTLALKPGEEKKLSLKYQVRYPKDQLIIVQ
jgi:hypothetical protein